MDVGKIENIDLNTIQKVLASKKISESEKTEFLNSNFVKISQVIDRGISASEYAHMMQSRPLQRFKPIKNSYTKRGDKILLAKSLGIKTSEVDDYIKAQSDKILMSENVEELKNSELDTIQTYVFRHGSKEEVLAFLDYQLSTAANLLKELYSTLKYNTGGIADFYSRPIHRMSNGQLVQIYDCVDNHLDLAKQNGQITDMQKEETAKWALMRIYQIQNNSKLRNAFIAYESL